MRKKLFFVLHLKKEKRANKRLYITPAFSWVLRGVSCEVVVSRLVLEMMKVHLHWRDNQAGHGWNKETERKRLLQWLKQAEILNWKYCKILCVCVCGCMHACMCVFSDVTLQACVNACPRSGCLHMCLGVFAGLPLHAPPNWESLKTSLLLWHFGPQHASLAMCDISPGVRGNGKQWPRLPGDAAAVTAEQQHGHFPQCPPYWSADSPQIPFTAAFPFHHLSPLSTALALHFCAILRVIMEERLGKIKR